MSNALQICASAYRQTNLDQTLASFSTTQEFPYSIALDLLQLVVQEMNRMGTYKFTETSSALTYVISTSSYDLTAVSANLDPQKITRVWTEATDHVSELTQLNYRKFRKRYRMATVGSGQPREWAKYNATLYTDVAQDQDYTLKVYYLQDIPVPTNTSSTFLIPTSDQDVLVEGVKAYLRKEIGRPDHLECYQVYMQKVNALLGNQKQDAGLLTQMPSAFSI